MRHEIKIIAALLLMFVMTQLIGLIVIDAYTPQKTIESGGVNKTIGQNVTIPYGMEPPEQKAEVSFASLAVSLVIAIFIFFLLMKFRARNLIRIWFTFVVFLTISIALTALLTKLFPGSMIKLDIVALILAVPLTFYKIFKRNIIVHNATELVIYPGLAAIFVPIMAVWSIIALLLIISAYDIWAVWKSKFMASLAKYQIEKVKVFTGFLVPYMPKKEALKLKKAQKIKTQRAKIKALKKIRVSMALLGGGDVAFPLIFAGVIYRVAGLPSALMIIAGSTISLLLLFVFAKKGKFYPAMPFITAGCLVAWLLTSIL
jgi:presenilin-like A22 family membrane protease